MKSINKLSGTICHSCRTIIGNSFTKDLLCPKCQEEAIELLKDIYYSGKEGHKELIECIKNIENFIKDTIDEESL